VSRSRVIYVLKCCMFCIRFIVAHDFVVVSGLNIIVPTSVSPLAIGTTSA